MKKQVLTLALIVFGIASLFGQNKNEYSLPNTLSKNAFEAPLLKTSKQITNTPEAVIWSEDFSGGIPSSWTNIGYDELDNILDSALWEYRGPSTSPSVSMGSRGAYANTTGTIVSPTAGNGFLIFDSDYLDNGGLATNTGNGKAPAPHKGILTTASINLTGYANVELSFNSYIRYFNGRALIAFSTDDGVTWTDTAFLHTDLLKGYTNHVNGIISLDVSTIIGNHNNVKLRFIFDGTYIPPNGPNISGYYFWMIDDLEIKEMQKHELRFDEWKYELARDIVFGNPNQNHSKMGHTAKTFFCDWTNYISFHANAYNAGYAPLHNVMLKVDILDGNNTLVNSSFSSPYPVLKRGALAYRDTLNTFTSQFKPQSQGQYKFIYSVLSDSASVVSDTFYFYVTDTNLSTDFNYYSNSIGTNEFGNDGSAIATRIDLDESISSAKIEKVKIGLSNISVPGGAIEIEIYDTTGFIYASSYSGGFPASNLVGTSNLHTITAKNISDVYFTIPVSDGINPFVNLYWSSYFIVVKMYSNAGTNPISIRNDQTFNQVTFGKLMYNTIDQRWYNGFFGSRAINAPHIRAIISSFYCPLGIDEDALRKHVSISPNPTTDFVHVHFTDYTARVTLTLTDLMGRVILKQELNAYGGLKHPIDMQNLPSATYLLQVNNGQSVITYKVLKR